MRLRVERVAHGGYCVAHHEGQVIFVRHTLPGELVDAEVTKAGKKNRFLFADAVRIIEPSPHRVAPPCPVSGPGGCGGCDWQHVGLSEQRRLKAAVINEQLSRLGSVPNADVDVHPVPGDNDGLEWRTTVRYAMATDGATGFRKHASHEIQPVDRCLIATPALQDAGTNFDQSQASTKGEVLVIDTMDGVVVSPEKPTRRMAVGRRWQVPATGFWQVHPGAADSLVAAVLAEIAGRTRLWDLYCGVGLFAGAAALDDPKRLIEAVESYPAAVASAKINLQHLAGVTVHQGDVTRWLHAGPGRLDPESVILDPPRKGAGERVLRAINSSTCTQIVYVACDPSALARDVATLLRWDWTLDKVTGFDQFPMTHHVEAVATLTRSGRD